MKVMASIVTISTEKPRPFPVGARGRWSTLEKGGTSEFHDGRFGDAVQPPLRPEGRMAARKSEFLHSRVKYLTMARSGLTRQT